MLMFWEFAILVAVSMGGSASERLREGPIWCLGGSAKSAAGWASEEWKLHSGQA